MEKETWVKYYNRPKLNTPIAIVGAPGLRSIGKLVIDNLLKNLKVKVLADLYSTHFPIVYQTIPSYAPHHSFPGVGGIKLESGEVDLPKIRFHYYPLPSFIITSGIHANFDGQYDVAEKVLNVYNEFKVKRIIIIAGYVSQEKEVCCSATNLKIIDEMKKKYEIKVDYNGPFYGFSGILFGLAKLRGIESLCLFGGTSAIPNEPQQPDEAASKILLNKLLKILKLDLFFKKL
jgi:proteasome assembly chaperone (PAC2) family protein